MSKTKQVAIANSQINTITVAWILSQCWESYKQTHEVRQVVIREVEKALTCRSDRVFIYECTECSRTIYQLLGCNSRLCSQCGKRYNDQWSRSLAKSMFRVPHRHFVLSIPDVLWPFLLANRTLWKAYMDSAIETCNEYFPNIVHDQSIRPGAVVILHPFGKDMKFQPHLHVIATEGGFNGRGRFVPKAFFPARPFARKWQYHVSRKLQEAGVPNAMFTWLYEEYDGFYVWVHRAGTIKRPEDVAKYLGRYVRHPAIANSRITGFDGKSVEFFYEREDGDGTKERHDVVMPADQFITSLIQHIPDSQFKMVRYYGAYSRRRKAIYASYVLQSSIAFQFQDTLYMPGRRFKPRCPYCGGMLRKTGMQTIPPPGDFLHWEVKKETLIVWEIREVGN